MELIDIYENEDIDGVRMTWNNLPANKSTLFKCVVPIGIHYSPFKDIVELIQFKFDPVKCRC